MFPWLKCRINAIKRRNKAKKEKKAEDKKKSDLIARESKPEVDVGKSANQ